MPGSEPIEWVPAQYPEKEIHDLRNAKLGPKGYKERNKRKLEEMEEHFEREAAEAEARMQDDEGATEEAPTEQASKRRKADESKFIPVSGRVWKAPAERAALVMKPKLGAKATSWERKQREKAARTAFLEHKKEAVAAVKEKRKASSEQRKAALARKKENRAKSEVTQVVSSATMKRMMKNKKQRKLLRTGENAVAGEDAGAGAKGGRKGGKKQQKK